MQALVYTRPGTVEVLAVEPPRPAADEVTVDVAVAGICGSELHGIHAPGFRVPPLVMGHEFAGTTPDGRRVVVNPILSCGSCDLCGIGRTQLCRERQIVGIHRAGGFAQQVAVPAASLHELPEGMTWEQAALVEPLANAVHAWALAAPGPGARVGVIGAGTIGLVCLLVAQRRQAAQVTVADLSPERLAVARRLGASSVVTELAGEFDLVFDAVGVSATHAASVDRIRPGGSAVWLGLMSPDAGFDSQALVRTEKRVLGSFAYTDAEFDEAVRLASSVDAGWLTSVSLADSAELFLELAGGRTDVIKAVVRP